MLARVCTYALPAVTIAYLDWPSNGNAIKELTRGKIARYEEHKSLLIALGHTIPTPHIKCKEPTFAKKRAKPSNGCAAIVALRRQVRLLEGINQCRLANNWNSEKWISTVKVKQLHEEQWQLNYDRIGQCVVGNEIHHRTSEHVASWSARQQQPFARLIGN